MVRYTVALASLLASKAIATDVSIDMNGAIERSRSLFTRVRTSLKFALQDMIMICASNPPHRLLLLLPIIDPKLGGYSHKEVP
jgi:hypothetical protein